MLKKGLSVFLAVLIVIAILPLTSFAITSGDWDYEVKDDGTATLTAYYGTASNMVIPSEIDGYTVTEIYNEALTEATFIKSISIPNTVTQIGIAAFAFCYALESVTLPDSVTLIDGSAFEGCSSLKSVNLGNGLTKVGNSAFYQCTALTSVTGGSNLKTIGVGAFQECTKLATITIPAKVATICNYAFYDCSSLSNVTIPASVTTIGQFAFANTAVKTITFNGTLAQWNLIAIGQDITPDNNVKVSCTEKDATDCRIAYSTDGIMVSWSEVAGAQGYTVYRKPTFGISAYVSIANVTGLSYTDTTANAGVIYTYAVKAYSSSNDYGIAYGSPMVAGNDGTIRSQDGLWEYYLIDDKTIVIVNGEYYDTGNNRDWQYCAAYYGSETDLVIPSTIDGYTVVGIGQEAFSELNFLESVDIPNSVTSISEHAFYNCASLTSITIPDSVTSIGGAAFSGCTALTDLTIPDSVASIGSNAFYACTSLTSVTILGNVIFFSGSPFRDCSAIKEFTVHYNPDCNYAPVASQITTVIIPDGITSVGEFAFDGCTTLTSITIPDSVTSIGDSAFSGCTSLTSITIPESVTSIGQQAFSCTALTSVTIPNSVKSLGSYAFEYCKSLTSVTIGNGITSIDAGAFSGCTTLTSVTIGNGVISVSGGAFSDCTALTSITIPDSVTSVGGNAFRGCTSLKNITIGKNVKEIGGGAFSGCSALESIEIPFGVTTLACSKWTDENGYSYSSDGLFQGCTSLKSVILPESLITIDDYAFYNCTKLKNITIPRSVTSIGYRALVTYNQELDKYSFVVDSISGYTGSYAETYAKENGITFIALDAAACNHTHTEIKNQSAATCTQNGNTGDIYCADCGELLQKGTVIIADGHPSAKWVITKQATYTEAGKKELKCTVCGTTIQTEAIPKLSGVDLSATTTVAKVANAKDGVNVSWAAVNGAQGYYVYRKTGSGSYSKIATTTALSYLDKTAQAGTAYTYTVRAYNGSTLSSYAGVKIIRLANTTLKLANQTAGIKLSWTKVAGAKGYYVYRKTGTGKYSKIATTTALSYVDKTAKAGVKYTYAVRAYNGSTQDAFTAVSIVRLATPNVKLANTKSGPKATWGKVAGAKGYYVYRKTAGGSYKKIATTTSLSYVDKTAKSGTRYYYIVKAYNGKSISSYAMKAITCKK